MKTLLTLIIATLLCVGCKKYQPETPVYCWECDFGSGMQSAGCYTNDEFKNKVFVDGMNNPIDKSTCKQKR